MDSNGILKQDEYVLLTDLQGNVVHKWGSRGTGPGFFAGINSIICVNHGAILVSDFGRVQALRRSDGSCFRTWRSAICGKKLQFFVHLGCIRELVFMLDVLRATIEVVELAGRSLFAFPVIMRASGVSCGPEEVYVINSAQVAVYSAADGTELRSLPTWSWSGEPTYVSYGPSAALALNAIPCGKKDDGIFILAPDGTLLGRTSHNAQPTVFSWNENSHLVGICDPKTDSAPPFPLVPIFKFPTKVTKSQLLLV